MQDHLDLASFETLWKRFKDLVTFKLEDPTEQQDPRFFNMEHNGEKTDPSIALHVKKRSCCWEPPTWSLKLRAFLRKSFKPFNSLANLQRNAFETILDRTKNRQTTIQEQEAAQEKRLQRQTGRLPRA